MNFYLLMRTLNANEVLIAWQEIDGELEPQHKEMFLTHSTMGAILQYPANWIRECLKRTPKLHKVLKILIETEKIDKDRGKNVMAETREKIAQSVLKAIEGYQYNTEGSKENPSDRTDWWREQE